MLKRSDRMGSLIELCAVDEQSSSALTNACSCSHRACGGVDSRGVNKRCSPGVTRDVNGGVDLWGAGEAQRM